MAELPALKDIFRLGRPKFLMYSNVIFTIGVVAAYKNKPDSNFQLSFYIWVCLLAHSIHAMTHYFNEFYDYEADCANKNPSPWTGGSRVLVEGKMKPEVSLYIARLIALIVLTNVAVIYVVYGNTPLCVTILLGVIFAHGYSAWPLVTSRRGLGEVTVCLVLNVLAPLTGYQSLDPESPLGSSLLWPILLSMLPMQYVRIMVMNMADYEGDELAGKRTLVVRLGLDVSSKLHGIGMVLGYIFHVWLFYARYISQRTFLLMLIPAPIGLRQIRNVLARPWRFDNPFWSSQHNLLVMAMALMAVLLSGGRPLTGKSWALVFPLVLVSISVPVLLMKIIDAARTNEACNKKANEVADAKSK